MDGANKFVKGDAIAGIIIVIINIVGGLLIGRFQQGLALGESVAVFTRLTVGDGLVAQVPALLIAIATGLVVTKSASESSLSEDLSNTNHVPTSSICYYRYHVNFNWFCSGNANRAFLTLGSVITWICVVSSSEKIVKEELGIEGEEESGKEAMKKPENLLNTLSLDPISLKTGRNLVPLLILLKTGLIIRTNYSCKIPYRARSWICNSRCSCNG